MVKKITDVVETPAKEVALVKDKKDLVRDLSSKAVINKNKMAYLNAKNRKKAFNEKEQETQQLKNEVAELKALVNELLKSKQV